MYKIKSLSLVNNRRLLNKATKEIHYTPQKPLQLILGQNGYGKSTLFLELSPLPAIPSDYIKGGYKHFVCEFNSHLFELRSDFTKGNRHSFLKDGQELNVGGTITVQKQLVKAELNYTPELHNLLLGKTKFTDLTTQKRKELLVSLCDVDVSFAMRLYASAATNARNVVGAIKHNERKLLETSTALLSPEEHAELSAQMSDFTKQMSELYSNKELGIHFTHSERAELQLVQQELEALAKRMLSTPKLDLRGTQSLAEFSALAGQLDSDVRNIQTQLQAAGTEYDSISTMLSQLTYSGEQTTEELQEERLALQNALQQTRINQELLTLADPDLVAMDALGLSDSFNDVLLTIEPNPDSTVYNRETVSAQEARAKDLQMTIDRYLYRQRMADEQMQHMKSAQESNCPKCGYVWIPGFSEVKYQQQEVVVEECIKGVEVTTPLLQETLEWLEKAQQWKMSFLRYREFVNTYPRLSDFWNQLAGTNAVYNAPRSLVGTLERYGRQALAIKEHRSLTERIALLSDILEKRKMLEQSSTVALSGRGTQLEQLISDLTDQLLKTQAELKSVTETLALVQTLTQRHQQLDRLLVEYSRLTLLKARVERNELLELAITEINQQSGLLASRLQKSTATIEIESHLKQAALELQKDEEAFEILLRELSPTDGLIAESLSGFVNAFVRQLNRIISRIWKSPLMIYPCAVEDGGLNYLFPVKMIDSEPTKDVSECSKGEMELINFVFVIVAAHYLGVSDYPLFMDEIGGAFSEEHRQSLFDYVKLLIETKTVNQVFIISHFAGTHGSLTHAEINIIDRTGILVTPEANANFRIV